MYTNLSRYYLHVLEVDDQITQRTMVHIQRIDQDTSSSMFLWSLRCSLSCTFFSYLCSVLWKLVLTFCSSSCQMLATVLSVLQGITDSDYPLTFSLVERCIFI